MASIMDTALYLLTEAPIKSMWISKGEKYRFCLPIIMLSYAWMYDEFKHPTISEMYQTDKYGVVISFASLSILRLSDCYLNLLHARRQDLNDNVPVVPAIRLVTYLSVFKIFCCNMIFKNHVSDYWLHRLAHFGWVALLGLCSLVTDHWFTILENGSNASTLRDNFIDNVIWTLGFGTPFVIMGISTAFF